MRKVKLPAHRAGLAGHVSVKIRTLIEIAWDLASLNGEILLLLKDAGV